MIKTDNIIILGGGSAGWMTAATLINQFPHKKITVIESPNTPTVGVGESTLSHINQWLNLLGIKDEDFMPHTDATYKLSIRFEDFYKKGDGGFHYPFGSIIEDNLKHGKQNWFFTKNDIEFTDFCNTNMPLVRQNTLFKNENNEIPGFDFKYNTAYHFDATKFGLWLRENYCKPKGVIHIEDDITQILDDETGVLELVGTKDNYKADFYFDCTGFQALIMNEMGEKFNSYENLLPNNKAWATRIPYKNKEKELVSYTNCTALTNGWVWNIPNWERIGTGYVYSDKHTTDLDALDEFKKYLKDKGSDYSNSKFKNITMRVGIYDNIISKNVCAIGLSAGFIEPLESNGLLSVHEFLKRLIKIMKRDDGNLSRYDIDAFNNSCKKFFDSFAQFVANHYALSHRKDSEYWEEISNKSFNSIGQQLINKDYIEKDQTVLLEDFEYFNNNFGMSYIASGFDFNSFSDFEIDFINDKIGENGKNKIISENNHRIALVEKWNNIAKLQPSLYEYLKNNIHGDKNE